MEFDGDFELTPEEMASFICIDCGINTDINGHYYILEHDVWALTGLTLGDNKMLCMPCCESRIGRKIEHKDLIDFPEINDSFIVRDYIDGVKL